VSQRLPPCPHNSASVFTGGKTLADFRQPHRQLKKATILALRLNNGLLFRFLERTEERLGSRDKLI
jgi:hypothetical protein